MRTHWGGATHIYCENNEYFILINNKIKFYQVTFKVNKNLSSNFQNITLFSNFEDNSIKEKK